jgi:hypothetical protein
MEKKQEFSSVSPIRLTIEDAAALINLTVDDALLVRNEIGETGNAALMEFEQTARAFRAQTNRSKKSQLTDQVNLERKVCADVFSVIKKTVVFEGISRIEPRKKAANDLEFFLKPNWDIAKSPIGDQIDQTVKMTSLYRANPLLVSAGQTIGIDMLMNELEANNAALSTTFKARELEDGKQAPSGSDLRPAATDSYTRFCSIIEQAANYTPNPAILDLFIKMDMLRKRYHALQTSSKDKSTAPSV